MKKLIIGLLLLITCFIVKAQVNEYEVTGTYFLKSDSMFIWRGDTIQHDSIAYVQFSPAAPPNDKMVRFRYIDGSQSDWYLSEDSTASLVNSSIETNYQVLSIDSTSERVFIIQLSNGGSVKFKDTNTQQDLSGIRDTLNKQQDTLTVHNTRILSNVTAINGKQDTLHGTGFVKVNGNNSTVYYDNETYIPTSEKAANNGVATLDAGGKVPLSQLPATLLIYKGVWSPLTNVPTLADGVGASGWVYRANLSGTTDFGSGDIHFYAGDWVIYNGSTWEKSAGGDNVVSVQGQQGVVSLDTDDIPEGSNLYFTDARAQTAVVSQTISDGVTDKSPSEDAVYGALGGKSDTTDISNMVTAASALGDNKLIKGDGTGRGVQSSGITIDDSNNISGVGTFYSGTNRATASTHNYTARGTALGDLATPTYDFEDSSGSDLGYIGYGSSSHSNLLVANYNGNVDLYPVSGSVVGRYNGNIRFQTTNSGLDITGSVKLSNLTSGYVPYTNSSGYLANSLFNQISGNAILFNGKINFRDDAIEAYSTASDDGALTFNYVGYAGGTDYYRDFKIFDGKGGLKFFLDGSTNISLFNTSVSVAGSANTGVSIQGIGTAATRSFLGLDGSGNGYMSLINGGTFQKNVQLSSDLTVPNYVMGNFGIGTTSPYSKLSFGSSGSANSYSSQIALHETGSGTYFYGMGIVGSSGNEGLALWGGTGLLTASATTPHLFIKRDLGKVGRGTTTPVYEFDNVGSVNTTVSYLLNGVDINTAGTLSNVAYLNQANVFTAKNTFNGGLTIGGDGGSGIGAIRKAGANLIIQSNTNSFYVANSDNSLVNFQVYDATGNGTFRGSIQATTAKFTSLTDGYIPYHVSDASGLANSQIHQLSDKIKVYQCAISSVRNTINENFFEGALNDVTVFTIKDTGYGIKFSSPTRNKMIFNGNIETEGGNIYSPTTINFYPQNGSVALQVQSSLVKVSAGHSFQIPDGAASGYFGLSDASGTLTWTNPTSINLSSFNNDANFINRTELGDSTSAIRADFPTFSETLYISDSLTIKSHIRDESIHFTQAEINIPASQINDFDTEVSNNANVLANSGKDTTGIYHANRTYLDLVSGTNTGDQDLSSLMVKANNLSDLTNAATARTNLGVDPAGTDNSTNVTLNASAVTGGMSIAGQEISNRPATNAQTGYATPSHILAIEANTAKVSNVSTSLSTGTVNSTTYGISSDGSANDVILTSANSTLAGLLTAAKYNEIGDNTSARHNAVTLGTTNGLSLSAQQLSLGLASTSTTGALNSTDFNNFNNKVSFPGFTSLSVDYGFTDNSTYWDAAYTHSQNDADLSTSNEIQTINEGNLIDVNAYGIDYTVDVDLSELSTDATANTSDYIPWVDASTGQRKMLISTLQSLIGGGISDGDKGDITVTSGVWNIDNGVIGADELASTGVAYGSYSHPSLTVDADGRITSIMGGTDNDYKVAVSGSTTGHTMHGSFFTVGASSQIEPSFGTISQYEALPIMGSDIYSEFQNYALKNGDYANYFKVNSLRFADTGWNLNDDYGESDEFYFLYNSVNKAYLTTGGVFYSYNQAGTSDSTLKTNIKPIDWDLRLTDNIDFVEFNFKNDLKNKDYGVIAQQVQPFVPKSIVRKMTNGKLSVFHDDLQYLLIARLKERITEQDKIIKQQDEKLSELEHRLDRLEALFEIQNLKK